MTPQVAYPVGDTLGEGPVWSVKEQSLFWIDIKRPSIQAWNPLSNEKREWIMPCDIGSFAFREKGGAIVALKSGLQVFDFETATISPLCDPEAHLPTNRFNDGKCDRQGRFWAGTMDDAEINVAGSLYKLDSEKNCQVMLTDVSISNGIGWSPDNAKMYYIDSPTQSIVVYDFELESGTFSNKRIFAKNEEGYPDGLTVDSEGHIWCAYWDGWKVIRYAPNGRIVQEVHLPVQRPTSCTFGGPELNQLYITSAKSRLSEAELTQQPFAGHVFVVETDTKGIPEPLYAG